MTDNREEVKEETTEDKSIHEMTDEDGESHMRWLPSGVVSFADFDAMEEAKKQAIKVKNDASLFKAMVDNILEIEPDEGMDKSQMIVDLANEFASRVQQPADEKEADLTKEEMHYKEVMDNAEKATDDDFQSGCERCGFGTKELIKEFDKCPYCWEAISEPV